MYLVYNFPSLFVDHRKEFFSVNGLNNQSYITFGDVSIIHIVSIYNFFTIYLEPESIKYRRYRLVR